MAVAECVWWWEEGICCTGFRAASLVNGKQTCGPRREHCLTLPPERVHVRTYSYHVSAGILDASERKG